MYHPKNIIDVLADNIRKTRNPFGAGNGTMNKWWKDASLPTEGDAMLYTGLMYQMMPYIKKMTHQIERFEDTKMADYVGYQKYVPKLLVKSAFVFMADKEDKEKFNHILRSMVKLLDKSGVNFFYRPKLDYYSGILLYDLGDNDGFIAACQICSGKAKKAGYPKNYYRGSPHHLRLESALSEIYRD